MDSKGNKLSSCQIPDQYLKKQQTFRTLVTLAEKNTIQYNNVVFTTLKMRYPYGPSPKCDLKASGGILLANLISTYTPKMSSASQKSYKKTYHMIFCEAALLHTFSSSSLEAHYRIYERTLAVNNFIVKCLTTE